MDRYFWSPSCTDYSAFCPSGSKKQKKANNGDQIEGKKSKQSQNDDQTEGKK
jgi:hypothetical protein